MKPATPKEGYFVRVPVQLLLSGSLSSSGLIMYAVLCDLADRYGIVQGVEQDRLARYAGMSRRSVQRALDELAAAGMIERQQTGRAVMYCVTDPAAVQRDWSAILQYRKEA